MTPRPKATRRARAGRGFTLVEVIAASVGMAIIFAASLTLLSLIAGGMPSRASASSPASIAPSAIVFDRICEDLSEAVEVIQTSANSYRFRLEDLDGDGNDEWFVYTWSGKPGDALKLARNGLPGVSVIDNVVSLDIDVDLATDTEPDIDYETISSERLVDGVSAMPGSSYNSTLTNSTGFHIAANLSGDTVRYSIDRIRIYIEDLDPDETLIVELNENNDFGYPIGPTIEQWVLNNQNISGQWVDLNGRNTREFEPGEGIGILLYAGNTSNAPQIRFSLGQGSSNVMSSRNILGWSKNTGIQPMLGVFGRETSPETEPGSSATVFSTVTLQIGVGEPGAARTLSRRVVMRNRPEVTP